MLRYLDFSVVVGGISVDLDRPITEMSKGVCSPDERSWIRIVSPSCPSFGVPIS